MKKVVFSLLAALSLTACAKGPGSIAPVSMGNAYAHLSCQEALHELSAERHTLATLESRQRSAATGDAVGVFLILVPVSSVFGGDVAGDVAVSKGKVIALENRMASCR